MGPFQSSNWKSCGLYQSQLLTNQKISAYYSNIVQTKKILKNKKKSAKPNKKERKKDDSSESCTERVRVQGHLEDSRAKV